MIHHHNIDLSTVLRGTVCALYSNLVTRPTGAAVRTEIERSMAEIGGRSVTVIDFSQVTLLDFSCADEIVAKLMLRYCVGEGSDAPATEGYFLFRNLGDHHLDAVESVLERHRLAIVAVIDGEAQLVGDVTTDERRAWSLLCAHGPADAATLAGIAGDRLAGVPELLERLTRRRLAMRIDGRFLAVGAALPGIAT